jgi:hypothetical protein
MHPVQSYLTYMPRSLQLHSGRWENEQTQQLQFAFLINRMLKQPRGTRSLTRALRRCLVMCIEMF